MCYIRIYIYIGCGPLTVTVTTRIITFLVGDPYKPSFTTVTVRGPHPTYTYIHLYIYVPIFNFHDCWQYMIIQLRLHLQTLLHQQNTVERCLFLEPGSTNILLHYWPWTGLAHHLPKHTPNSWRTYLNMLKLDVFFSSTCFPAPPGFDVALFLLHPEEPEGPAEIWDLYLKHVETNRKEIEIGGIYITLWGNLGVVSCDLLMCCG